MPLSANLLDLIGGCCVRGVDCCSVSRVFVLVFPVFAGLLVACSSLSTGLAKDGGNSGRWRGTAATVRVEGVVMPQLRRRRRQPQSVWATGCSRRRRLRRPQASTLLSSRQTEENGEVGTLFERIGWNSCSPTTIYLVPPRLE